MKATKVGEIYRVERSSSTGKVILAILGGLLLLGMLADDDKGQAKTTSAPYSNTR